MTKYRTQVNVRTASFYIVDIIDNVISYYILKSNWGLNGLYINETNKTSKDYLHPSFRKYKKFCMVDKFRVPGDIVSHLYKGFNW